MLVAVIGLGLIAVAGIHIQTAAHKVTLSPEIRSGISGYCLDDHHDGTGLNAAADSWSCNGSVAQHWTVAGNTIRHDADCLSVLDNGTASGDKVVSNACNNSPSQAWTVDLGGFENPHSGLCLAIPDNHVDKQLVVASCNDLDQSNEAWSAGTWSDDATANLSCDQGTRGQKVACYAQEQWLAWESGSPSHQTLLTDYTDGNAYEQWCADFVSYVYKEAGYPFAAGERDGWDEYDANNIQNMGFVLHPAAGYDPQAGDVAFFDYPGGHVEIVVSGGPHPTFIYGDSGTTDPQTGNGAMNEDTLTSDGSAGQVIYYLSPD